MSYKALTTASNISISEFSARRPGETSARSEWDEIPYREFKLLSFRKRAELADKLAAQSTAVHIKTATGYGHARIFVKA